jgi:hypothetical protein
VKGQDVRFERQWAYEIDLDPERFRLGYPLRWLYDEAVTTVTYQYGPDPDETLELPFVTAAAVVALVREADNPLVAWLESVEGRHNG